MAHSDTPCCAYITISCLLCHLCTQLNSGGANSFSNEGFTNGYAGSVGGVGGIGFADGGFGGGGYGDRGFSRGRRMLKNQVGIISDEIIQP